MFEEMAFASNGDGAKKWHFQQIPSNAGSSYKIDCGFKAKKIVMCGTASASRIYAYNVKYDRDVDPDHFIMQDSSSEYTYSVGYASSPGITEITDTSVTISNPLYGSQNYNWIAIAG